MAVSRRQAAVAVVGTIALALVACDSLLGLGQYQDVACAPDCDSGTKESGTGPVPDAAGEADAGMTIESGLDADAEADAEASVVTTPDSGWPVPTSHELWAHWPMPNPDAAIGAESSTPLPNPMTYTTGADGGSTVAYDAVTKLSWWRQAVSATTYDAAWGACISLGSGSGWRVPTRIELVSLIDFTQPSGSPTIDPTVFPTVKAQATWTSSAVAGAGTPTYWVVDFVTGLTGNGAGGIQVLCVNGGTP